MALAIIIITISTSLAADPTNQELLALIKQQQEQIEQLKQLVLKNQQKVNQTDEKIESTVEAIETTIVQAQTEKTHLGGYGELHYNNIDDNEQIDFHRFVLFLGHEFTENIRLFSELEIEHSLAGDGKPGEVELEQAYIEMGLTEDSSLKAGLFLLPVGILNETHEPNTFFGVERNPIEKNIIPSTWWEAGASVKTDFSEGWSADFAIHSGLDVPTEGSKSFLIRSGRQKVAKANADNFAFTLRLKYTAIPGVELAASYQIQDDITQGAMGVGASLFSTHGIYNKDKFGLRALYAIWNLDGNEAELLGRDKQSGFYIEPAYRFSDTWGIFARYNVWDNNAGSQINTEMKQSSFGINYWPHNNVVFKLDIENNSGTEKSKGFNIGVGYMF